MAISLIDRAEAHGDRLAVSATDGEFSYRDLLAFSARVAGGLLVGRKDLEGARVAFLVPSCFAYPAIQPVAAKSLVPSPNDVLSMMFVSSVASSNPMY